MSFFFFSVDVSKDCRVEKEVDSKRKGQECLAPDLTYLY